MNVFITLAAAGMGLGQIPFALNFFGSVFSLSGKLYKHFSQIFTSLIVGFISYKSVAFLLEGITKPVITNTTRTISGVVSIVFFIIIYRYLVRNMKIFGELAVQNPWDANTLEWVAPTPAPHGNFGPELPVVFRNPYEYSVPGETEDWAPQTTPLKPQADGASH